MTTIEHTYVARDDPFAQELLTRFLKWSTAVPQNFNAVVAYEDIHAARKAKEVCDRVRCRTGGPFEVHLWRFDVLHIPQLRDTAVKDAAQAHLMILATCGEGGLPPHVENWIELSLAERLGRPGALVLLVEPARELSRIEDTPQYEYLEKIAQRARMEFFASLSRHPRTQSANMPTVD